jgi:hypothetical protein
MLAAVVVRLCRVLRWDATVQLLAIILVLSIGGVFVVGCAWAPFASPRLAGWKRVGFFVGSALAVVGGLGFFGSALSDVGGLNWLPGSFEWPAGYVTGVATLGSGLHVVPHTPSGRIQVYDSDWKFLRGWHIDAGGGTFKLRGSGADRIDVFTPRGQWHYVFNDRGGLILKVSYAPESYSSFECASESALIPTAPWLWVFTHPGISWSILFVGIVVMQAVDSKPRKKVAA